MNCYLEIQAKTLNLQEVHCYENLKNILIAHRLILILFICNECKLFFHHWKYFSHHSSWSLLFLCTLSQTGDVFVLQDLSLLLRLKQSVGHHRFSHHLDWDGHRCRTDSRQGTKEFPGQPLTRPALLPVYQQDPVGEKYRRQMIERLYWDQSGYVQEISTSNSKLDIIYFSTGTNKQQWFFIWHYSDSGSLKKTKPNNHSKW